VADVEANKSLTQDNSSVGEVEQKKKDKRAFCISLATLILSIPALISA